MSDFVFPMTAYAIVAMFTWFIIFEVLEVDPFFEWPSEASSVAKVAVSLLWPLVIALAAVAVALRCVIVLVRGVRQMIGMVHRRPDIPRAEVRSRRIR